MFHQSNVDNTIKTQLRNLRKRYQKTNRTHVLFEDVSIPYAALSIANMYYATEPWSKIRYSNAHQQQLKMMQYRYNSYKICIQKALPSYFG